MRIARGTRKPDIITTSLSKAATAKAIAWCGKSAACDGWRRQVWSSIRSTTSPCRARPFLSGHVVEHYQVALTDAAGGSEQQMRAALERLCAQQVPGDTHRNLRIYPTFSGKTFKHLLVPIWLLVYTFGRNPFQVVVNGYTGRIAGRYPYSPWKVAFLIVLVVLAIMLFALASEG